MSDSSWSHYTLGVMAAKLKIWCSEDLLESYGIPKLLNLPEFAKFARFRKNHNFQVAASQEKKKIKVGSLLYVKCAWFCSQTKHKI